jgi:branched-chain amino acid transport system ATP-binding protein
VRIYLTAGAAANDAADDSSYRLQKPHREENAVAGEEIILGISDLSVRFGGVVALDSVSFDVARGAICGLIGPNGAGKTTVFNCLSRLYTPQQGEIRFNGASLLDCPVHRIARQGIGRTFQHVALFSTMSVIENIRIGGWSHSHTGFMRGFFRSRATREEERTVAEKAAGIADFLGLTPHADTPVGRLPFGIQKRVELGRALALDPQLLLLDEPAGGLNHEELESLRDTIVAAHQRFALTTLLVEHNVDLVMGISDQVVVLDFGRKIAHGTPEAVRNDPAVIKAYLGDL